METPGTLLGLELLTGSVVIPGFLIQQEGFMEVKAEPVAGRLKHELCSSLSMT